MGLLQKIEIAQINILNNLNGLKRLQGVRPNSKHTLIKRASFADLGILKNQKMLKIYHVPNGSILSSRSKYFGWFMGPLWLGMSWSVWSQNTGIIETGKVFENIWTSRTYSNGTFILDLQLRFKAIIRLYMFYQNSIQKMRY